MGDDNVSLSKEKDWKVWETEYKGVPFIVFNPLSWEVKAPIQINTACKGITDETGNAMEFQIVRASQTNGIDKWDTLFMSTIPAMGYRVYWIYKNKEVKASVFGSTITAGESALENDFIRLEIDESTGYISKLFDKRNNVEVIKGNAAVPVVIDEVDCDTWAHGIFKFRNEIGRFGNAAIRLVENGPIRAKLRVTSRYNDSTLQQDFILYGNSPNVEVRAKLDWREKHKLLKLSFPVNVENPEATYEIPFGFITRPVDGTEEHGHQWLDVSGIVSGRKDPDYGLALLNDSKYSFDVKDNDMRMTVVRSPIFADHFGERDDLCEYMDQAFLTQFLFLFTQHIKSSYCWTSTVVAYSVKAHEVNLLFICQL